MMMVGKRLDVYVMEITYAASLDQTASRVFWAAVAINNFITIGADASNAFAEAPAPHHCMSMLTSSLDNGTKVDIQTENRYHLVTSSE